MQIIWVPSRNRPSRASSTKTRIETSYLLRARPEHPGHQEQVPRKQGLKHVAVSEFDFDFRPSRASSTKTRIET